MADWVAGSHSKEWLPTARRCRGADGVASVHVSLPRWFGCQLPAGFEVTDLGDGGQKMFDVFDLTAAGPVNPGARGDAHRREPAIGPQATRDRAIKLLLERGFVHLGEDPTGLPCFRSPSGAVLISVGSCRALAYANVGGRLQVVAAARTAALVCRIAPASTESLPSPRSRVPSESSPSRHRAAALV
jgi:hypothetical protein